MADRKATANARTLPTVMAVGAGTALTGRCRIAATAAKAFFEWTDVANAATSAARCRPLVLVISEDVYAFDGNEFEALARDIRARLVRVDEDVSAHVLDPLVRNALVEAARTRGA
ncbi:MAG: hypothetical protein WKG00_00225 [Polyangiaceae bacterium]